MTADLNTNNAVTSNAVTSNAVTSNHVTTNQVIAGVDVGKAMLDVSVACATVQRFDNDTTGIAALCKALLAQGVTMVICEPTGGYERALTDALRRRAIAVHTLHPNKMRGLARAMGTNAKTDALDAQVLARYGQLFASQLQATEPLPPEVQALKALMRRRDQLLGMRTQEMNRQKMELHGVVGRSCRRHLKFLDKEIALIDQRYQKLVAENAPLREKSVLYQSVPGIGQLSAALLMACLPELGTMHGKQITALAGLAPWNRDSGKHSGKRPVHGGRSVVRRLLYLPGLSTARYHPDMKRFRDVLKVRGKPGKVRQVAVMRKLLLQLNAVAKRGTCWQDRQAVVG